MGGRSAEGGVSTEGGAGDAGAGASTSCSLPAAPTDGGTPRVYCTENVQQTLALDGNFCLIETLDGCGWGCVNFEAARTLAATKCSGYSWTYSARGYGLLVIGQTGSLSPFRYYYDETTGEPVGTASVDDVLDHTCSGTVPDAWGFYYGNADLTDVQRLCAPEAGTSPGGDGGLDGG